MTEPAARPAFWMITSAVIFSAMGAFAHALGPRCDWLTVAFVRAFVMLVSALVVARWSGVTLVLWKPRILWMRSLAGTFSLMCSFYALTHLPIGDVLTITNTYPLWILVLTWFSLRQMPHLGELFGVLSGMVGVALIEQPHLDGDKVAFFVALLASFASAVAMIGLHKLREVDHRAVVAHFAGVASCLVGAWLVARGVTFVRPLQAATVAVTTAPTLTTFDPVTVLLLMGVGLTGTVGQIFLTKAYAYGAPAKVSVLGLTQVVFAMGLDVLLWQRAITLASLAGTALVLAPSAWLLRRAGEGVHAAPAGTPRAS